MHDGPDFELRQMNALLRYHFKIDPDLLTDEEWSQRWNELEWVLRKLSENNAKE